MPKHSSWTVQRHGPSRNWPPPGHVTSVITRDNIKKAYGEGPRAKAIREFLYKYWKESGVVGVRDHEVKFKYLAKVLCIFQEGICKPNTMSDLINLGTAKQMLVAMKFKGGIGMYMS